jgi:hypothetical protein
VPTFADRGYHVIRVTDNHGRILGFLDRVLLVFFCKPTTALVTRDNSTILWLIYQFQNLRNFRAHFMIRDVATMPGFPALYARISDLVSPITLLLANTTPVVIDASGQYNLWALYRNGSYRQVFKRFEILHLKKSLFSLDSWREKSRACSSFSFTSRGLFTNDSSWQATQSIPRTTGIFYGDCVKMWEDFTPKFGDKKLATVIFLCTRVRLSH